MFDVTEGRAGVVVSFLAILELVKAATLELVQPEAYAPIHVRLRGGEHECRGRDGRRVPRTSPSKSLRTAPIGRRSTPCRSPERRTSSWSSRARCSPPVGR
jgi:hypothetical protein